MPTAILITTVTTDPAAMQLFPCVFPVVTLQDICMQVLNTTVNVFVETTLAVMGRCQTTSVTKRALVIVQRCVVGVGGTLLTKSDRHQVHSKKKVTLKCNWSKTLKK
eukprot:TRINITY_DN66403_c3_g18_i1.p3 TRINITY_DN66403_c3_g18~~TRINITY_DN66403_c3_g18_i1.p3  ORF type:complete len:107 (+),score=8.27 TRINITY_DN66403_c3_g18_i1:1584-1904(+)